MLRTRTNSSRISCVSWRSCSSVSDRKSMGEVIWGSNALIECFLFCLFPDFQFLQHCARSSVSLQDELYQSAQAPARGATRGQMRLRLTAQFPGSSPALV